VTLRGLFPSWSAVPQRGRAKVDGPRPVPNCRWTWQQLVRVAMPGSMSASERLPGGGSQDLPLHQLTVA
jgi:hypothetical protein